MGMLGFQNRALDINLLKFHANQDNWANLEKCDFQRKLVIQILDHHWICGIKMSPGVVSIPDSESQLALHSKRGKTFNCQIINHLEKHAKFEIVTSR